MKTKAKIPAVAYLRTSSAANTGEDKDSGMRQRQAISAYAKAAGIEIVEEYYDEAVSGADLVEARPGFRAMLERLLTNGVRTVVVETANRFARDLIVQETGYALLKARGIELIAADKPDAFLDDGPTSTLIRQVLGAVSQFEKAMLVTKLRGARERKRATGVKVEGRKSHAEKRPEVVELARQLRRKRPKGGQRSYREISAELFARGHVSLSGKPFTASSVRKMLEPAS
jgi:DNA invertase Pin-like site-specific DNA recombinase